MNTDLIREICQACDDGVPVEEWAAPESWPLTVHELCSPLKVCYGRLIGLAALGYKFTRKPRTVTRTISYPAGVSEAPKRDAQIFVASATYREFYFQTTWTGCEWDRRTFDRGLIHLTTEAAEAHGRAMAGEADE